MTTRAQVAAARAEILRASDADIERETASRWMARALAAYELAGERRCIRWLLRATTYHHEASEHAAGVSPAFLQAVEGPLQHAKAIALERIGA